MAMQAISDMIEKLTVLLVVEQPVPDQWVKSYLLPAREVWLKGAVKDTRVLSGSIVE